MTGSPRSRVLEVIELLDGIGPERVRVAVEEMAGTRVIDIRVVTLLSKSSGAWFPTSQGVRIAPRSVPALIEALERAQMAADAAPSDAAGPT